MNAPKIHQEPVPQTANIGNSQDHDENFTKEVEPHSHFRNAFLRKYGTADTDLESNFKRAESGASKLSVVGGQTHRWSVLSRLIVDWWLWELLSWVIGALSFCGIALILGYFDNRTLSSKGLLGITINAYISVLSAIGKFALAVPVEEALGQLKWLWFSAGQPRKLIDFERFDGASRGPWGSFMFLLHMKGRSFASLGAIVTLLSLTLDPFFQQVVTFPQRPSIYGRSMLTRVVRFNPMDAVTQDATDHNTTIISPDGRLDEAIGPYFLGNPSVPPVNSFCPSGTCTWPKFDTLALCGACEDIGNLLTFDCLYESGDWRSDQSSYLNSSYGVTWVDAKGNPTSKTPAGMSCGYFLNATSDNPIMMTGYALSSNNSASKTVGQGLLMRQLPLRHGLSTETKWGGSIHFPNTSQPIIDFITVATEDGTSVYANKTPVAHECMLQWCVKTIAASSSNGEYKEEVVSTFVDGSGPLDGWHPFFRDGIVRQHYSLNVTLTPPGQNDTFWVSNLTMFQQMVLFNLALPSYLTVDDPSTTPILRYSNILRNYPALKKTPNDPWLPPTNISQHFENMATSMDRALRSYPNTTEKVFGTGSFETYVHIRWAWLTLPFIVLLLSSLFLFVTILESCRRRDVGIWKTSSLATLAYGLSDDAKDELGSSRSMLELIEKANGMEVSAMPGENARLTPKFK
ncbi:hypothetical protein EJ06DRAFT_471465 [Trichodelitschia bisporula]|uniref:DUF3176 domain-containing protein n=1 Tax=Trichodelitschia bisporula TaxID=703511 RepID=A0A6G1I5E4_9PEZI|nr:hypothetical protein EJ06DRAFT_471465 [Trichodelitschia bisporula]